MSWPRDRQWIESRFAGRRAIPTRVDMPEEVWQGRGDHDLNAGMEPTQPLKPAAVLVPLIDRGESIGAEPLDAARARHAASLAELPATARQLSRGEPVIPTILEP